MVTAIIRATATVLFSAWFPAFASETAPTPPEQVFALEYLRAEDVARSFRQTFPEAEVAPRNGRLVVRSDEGTLRVIAELLERIDLPSIRPPTMFVDLHTLDAADAAVLLGERFQDENPPLTVVPQARTSRIFLMGTPEVMKRAAKLIRTLDLAA